MKNSILFILSVVLVGAAFLQLPDLSLYDSKRIFQLGVFAVTGLAVMGAILFKEKLGLEQHVKKYGSIFENRYILGASLVFVLAGVTSSVLSSYPSYALLEVTFLFLMISLVVVLSPGNRKQHFQLGRVIFITSLGYVGLYIIVFTGNYISILYDPMMLLWPNKYDFTIVYEGMEFHGTEVLYFDNIRFFNHTQTWTLPILIGLLAYIQKKKYLFPYTVLLTVLTACWWMLLFASGGRGTIIGVIAAVFGLTLLWRKELYLLLKNGIITCISGVILYFSIFILPFDSNGGTALQRGSAGRFESWWQSVELWLQNPLFGVGPMHFAELRDTPYLAHPHNFYLQLLSEWGMIVFFAFTLLLGAAILFIYKQQKSTKPASANRIIYISFTWSLCAAMIHAFFSGIMHTPMSQLWLIVIAAWFFGFKKRMLPDIKHRKRSYIGFLYLAILLAVAGLLYYNGLFNLQELYSDYINRYPGQGMYPRFWRQGLFPVE